MRSDIERMAKKYDREPSSIQLLAVSKTKPAELVAQANEAGQNAFGENYPDEGLEKITLLRELDCEWHFIGSIQSRKAAGIAQHFDWVHSVDRLKVAKKLSENRPENKPALQICLQVNIDKEASKSGVPAEQVLELAEQCHALPQLCVRGLMCIPAPQTQIELQRDAFRRVRELHEMLQKTVDTADTLSMGMSADLEAAIAEGATIVRVGTAIFGARAQR